MLKVTDNIEIDDSELQESFVRSSGPGGQNVNKVATAVQLRFNARGSRALPNDVAIRLMRIAGSKLTKNGEIVIIAQQHRSLERNRAAARERLFDMIREAAIRPTTRKATKQTKASKTRRLEGKKSRGDVKAKRGSARFDD